MTEVAISAGDRTSHTRRSVFELFLKLEEKHALWEQRTSWGICYWKIIRFSLYESILKQLGLTEDRRKAGRGFKSRKRSLILDSLRSVLLYVKKVDTIILEYPRKVMNREVYVDPFTTYLANELREKATSFLLVGEGPLKNLNPSWKGRRCLGGSIFEKFVKLCIKTMGDPLDTVSEERLKTVLQELSSTLGVTIEYDNTRRRLVKFEQQRRVWKQIINHTRCHDLYLVCSYGHEGVIAAAQEAGVRVMEIQHGMIVKYHPGYSFGRETVPYFPDRLFVFGKKWCGSFLPLASSQCLVTGHRFLNEYTKKVADYSNKHGIVFLSQWSVNEKLFEFVRNLHQAQPSLEITYKFHPLESDLIVEQARNDHPGIEFIKNEKHLYDILAGARIAAGVFSTSILEALAFGCRVVLLDAPGIELLEDIIMDLNLPVVKDTSEFEKLIDSESLSITADSKIEEWFHGCRG